MVRNNFSADIKELCELENISKAEAGRRSEIAKSDVNKIGRYEVFPKRFVKLIESIGYDVEVIYHRRDDADQW